MNNRWITEEIYKGIKNFLEMWKWKHKISKYVRYTNRSMKRDIYGSKYLHFKNKKERDREMRDWLCDAVGKAAS